MTAQNSQHDDADRIPRSRSLTGLPAACAAVAFACVVAGAALRFATREHASARAAVSSLDRAHAAADTLLRLAPARMERDGFSQLATRLEQDLSRAGASSTSIRSLDVQTSNTLSGVNSTVQRARAEFHDLSLQQVAVALDSIETSNLPLWITSVDLSGTSEGDQWNATVQVEWVDVRVALAR